MFRFRLNHLLAFTTLSAILLSIGAWTGVLQRDGVWEVVSIAERRINCLIEGPLPIVYIATLRDGDRERYAWIEADCTTDTSQLSKLRLTLVFDGPQTPLGKSALSSSFPVYAGTILSDPVSYDVDENTRFLPSLSTGGYSPILNLVVVLFFSATAIGLIETLRIVAGWLSDTIPVWLQRQRDRREHYRRTHIV